MKTKVNKNALIRVLTTFNLGNNVTVIGRQEVYSHYYYYILLLLVLLEAVKNGKKITSD